MAEMKKPAPQTIDEYITAFPKDVQAILQNMRKAVHEAAPEASEKISYQMPCFYLKGNLVYFGAWKDHLGFYPVSSGIEKFKKELSGYEFSKGTVRFPFNEPIPYDLIRKIVKFRVEENLAKAAAKGK